MRVPSATLILSISISLVAGGHTPGQPNPLPPKIENRKRANVRSWQELFATSFSHDGVVVDVSEEKMTVRSLEEEPGPRKTYEYHPIDRLLEGQLIKNASGCFTYRWKDVKQGDRVRVHGHFDDGEQRWYCFEICIDRRPGDKLPVSQDPKNDGRYKRDSLLNDIENGEDVSDEAIREQFAPRFESLTAQIIDHGGLPKEYQAKLDAIRAKKKDADLKAKPPEKKGDKK